MTQLWKNILVSPSTTMEETIKVIDIGALKLALVVDSDQTLLGVVTDGDIRRALIRHQSMDTPIIDVMNNKPLVADVDTTKARLLSLMKKNSLIAIPLIKNNKLVGLETLEKIVYKPNYENPIFLMAGGFGTRLRPLTNDCPKPLLKLGGKPILETIIENFVNSGFHNFYISTHFLSEKIKEHFGDGSDWGVNIEYVYEESPLGTAGALGLLPDSMPKLPVIMMNGDLLTKVDFEHLLSYHLGQKSLATMCVTEYEYQVPYGVVESVGNQVVSMVEKPLQRHFINAGIYVINPELVAQVEKNQVIDMPTLIEQKIAENHKVSIFPIHEYWLDIGKMNDFNQAQIDVRDKF